MIALDSTFAVDQSQLTEYANIGDSERDAADWGNSPRPSRRSVRMIGIPPIQTRTKLDYQFSFTPAYYFREGYSVFIRNVLWDQLPERPHVA